MWKNIENKGEEFVSGGFFFLYKEIKWLRVRVSPIHGEKEKVRETCKISGGI